MCFCGLFSIKEDEDEPVSVEEFRMKEMFLFSSHMMCLSAVALKKQSSNCVIESGDHSETAGSEDGQIPEGELLLQVGEQQASMSHVVSHGITPHMFRRCIYTLAIRL